MKRIAFYAPMKPPGHPTPSGDREMARALIVAMRRAGFEVDIVSKLRSWEGAGDLATQMRIRRVADKEIARLASVFEAQGKPDLWFTYHLYHKAPDWLGPALAQRFNLPYCVAEASLASKRKDGDWRDGYAQSLTAIGQADRIFQVNPQDSDGLRAVLGDTLPIVDLPPFLLNPPSPMPDDDRQRLRQNLAEQHKIDVDRPWMLAVGMMRADSKRDSYKVLAEALACMSGNAEPLLIVGNGPARPQIEAMFSGRPNTVFLGSLSRDQLNKTYGIVDLFVWPAINEAFGMALLEAQAAGLPVVAGDRLGVAAMIRDGETGLLVPEGDPQAFAVAMNLLVANATMRRKMSVSASVNVSEHHSLTAAAHRLGTVLTALIERPS